jgi:DNA-binding NarL/FixJ family response regulator
MAARLVKSLTPRESEALRAAVRGLDNPRVADELVISPLTAKTHINRAMVKLGVSDRTALVSLAYHAGVRP